MKVLFIQLSDIHIVTGDNSILTKANKLFQSIKNTAKEYDEIFLLVTGDSVFSGKSDEFAITSVLINELKTNLVDYTGLKVNAIVIPGNHDCDFADDDKSRRNNITLIQKFGDTVIDDSVISVCCKTQNNYFTYQDSILDAASIIYQDKIVTILEYKLNDYNIIFSCYNSAYISEIVEQPGKMIFPVGLLPNEIYEKSATLFVSLFHHPLHWLAPTNNREFTTFIHKTSDFYLTGHEHIESKSLISDLENNYVKISTNRKTFYLV